MLRPTKKLIPQSIKQRDDAHCVRLGIRATTPAATEHTVVPTFSASTTNESLYRFATGDGIRMRVGAACVLVSVAVADGSTDSSVQGYPATRQSWRAGAHLVGMGTRTLA